MLTRGRLPSEHATAVRDALLTAGEGGRIFTVRFVKRTNGEERRMTCRLGVKKALRGGTPAYDPRSYNLMTVYDVRARDYRSVNLETVFDIKSRHLFPDQAA